jgi:hypothetical protein
MKKILMIVALAIASLTMSAKEISKNPDTGATLCENLGVYSIRAGWGCIVLGTRAEAKSFLKEVNGAFKTEFLDHVYNFGNDKYTVQKDEKGYYITDIGLGVVILRPADTFLFIGVLNTEDGIKTTKKLAKNIADKTGLTKYYNELTK